MLGGGQIPGADGQDEATTRLRIAGKEVWLARQGLTGVGTFTLASAERASGTWWYRRPGVAEISRVAVHPEYQRRGYFSILLDFAETRARESGAAELAGSVPSQRKWLIEAYCKRGCRIVDYKWSKHARYGCVVFSKPLGGVAAAKRFLPPPEPEAEILPPVPGVRVFTAKPAEMMEPG